MNIPALNRTADEMDATISHASGEPSRSAESMKFTTDSLPSGSGDRPMNAVQREPHRYLFTSGSRPLEGYTIKRAIGRGGFGEVYFAVSDAGKEVALKLILRDHDVECRGVSQCMNLKSPNLLTIHDIRSNDSGETFVVMEYVAGPSLAQVLARNPKGLADDEVRSWLRGIVDGVDYLHDHGIVHRDLKPANIFIEEGIVKIGDYGLSKLINPGVGTEHSESVGTCHYMAPEVSTGKYNKPIDIYAIGVILFEMLTGRVPFEGETVGEVLMKHLTARPDLSPLAEPYRTIVGKALAKDPIHRPIRALELLPEGDAPRKPAIRFIGDPAAPAAAANRVDPVDQPADRVRNEKKEDDVFRIGEEEPVFYIGPETRPPGSRLAFHDWLWGAAPAGAAGRNGAPPRPQSPGELHTGAAARPRNRLFRRRPEPPLPVAPPLPSGRIRVSELSGSMLLAAILIAAFCFPLGAALGVRLNQHPENLVYLYMITLLTTWGALVPAKIWEGRSVDPGARRFVYLMIGLMTAGVCNATAYAMHVRIDPPFNAIVWNSDRVRPFAGYALSSVAFFAVTTVLLGRPTLAFRDRRVRFRVGPAITAALVGLVAAGVCGFPTGWGVAAVATSAVVVQLVSPWCERSAAATRARLKRGRKQIV